MCHCGNRGLEQTPKKSQHTKLTLEKEIPPQLLLGFELAIFQSRVWRSTDKLFCHPRSRSSISKSRNSINPHWLKGVIQCAVSFDGSGSKKTVTTGRLGCILPGLAALGTAWTCIKHGPALIVLDFQLIPH